MKENLKWTILGVCLIISAVIYVFGTRYQAVNVHSELGDRVIIYDRITGKTK
jgi:hypothetical protein